MKIFLADNVKASLLVSDGNKYEYLELKKGMYLDSMNYQNLPKHIKEDIDKYIIGDIKNKKIFIIYMKRKYWRIDNTNSLQVCKC